MTDNDQIFEAFAKEPAYIHVNERLVGRMLRHLKGYKTIHLLDLAAATGLMTSLTDRMTRSAGIELKSTLLDLDLPALHQARREVTAQNASYLYASADSLPLRSGYDAVIFGNSIHLLDNESKEKALAENRRVLRDGGVLAVNTTFYEGAYPEESKPFYSRWIRRAIVEINRRLPQRDKAEKVQALEFLPAQGYRDLITRAGFKIVEMRERRVLLSQAAVRAISSYKEFAKGALHATDEDAEEAARALQVSVRQTFNDLHRIFDFIEAEKVNRACFYHLVPSGRGHGVVDLSPAESRQAMDVILERTMDFHRRNVSAEILTVDNHCDGPYMYLKMKAVGDPRAEEVYEMLKWNGGGLYPSGVGFGCIDFLGNVHPDQFWMHYTFGNVRERKFSEIWMDTADPLMAGLKDRRKRIKGRCVGCRFLDLCGGALRVRAEIATGDPWASDPACYLTDEEIGLKPGTGEGALGPRTETAGVV